MKKFVSILVTVLLLMSCFALAEETASEAPYLLMCKLSA